MEFKPFPKIPRFFRDITITEKLDGTNASIYIGKLMSENDTELANNIIFETQHALGFDGENHIYAGSRNRWITPESDNYGFAKWVKENAKKLVKLGPGHHFGEWWGNGIQRNYELKEKRFSLFNTKRWGVHVERDGFVKEFGCYTVPVLFNGPFRNKYDQEEIDIATQRLKACGSFAAPGFMKPEGIIVYHEAGNHLYKILLENDDKPKGNSQNRKEILAEGD